MKKDLSVEEFTPKLSIGRSPNILIEKAGGKKSRNGSVGIGDISDAMALKESEKMFKVLGEFERNSGGEKFVFLRRVVRDSRCAMRRIA